MPNQNFTITGSAPLHSHTGTSSSGQTVTGQITGSGFNSSGFTISKHIYTNADLPATVFHMHDDSQKEITMTLKPEYSITAPESMKIMMMLAAAIYSPQFSVFQFVKKNDLERHFKYA